MPDTGHKNPLIRGKNIAEHLRPVIQEEAQFFKVPEPSDKQIALVVSALRMHHTMLHASTYDRSELHPHTDRVTDFYPIESSIGRFLRDSARVVLDYEEKGEE